MLSRITIAFCLFIGGIFSQAALEDLNRSDDPQFVRGAREIASAFSQTMGPAYLTLSVGGLTYEQVENLDTEFNLGGSIGQSISPNIDLELSFFISRHVISEDYWRRSRPLYKKLDQYNVSTAFKYTFPMFGDRFRPYAALVGSYSRREYSNIYAKFRGSSRGHRYNRYHYNRRGDHNVRAADSRIRSVFYTDAFELGGGLGADLKIARGIYVGAQWRRMMNLVNQDNTYYMYEYLNDDESLLEDLSYSTFTGYLKFLF